AWYRLSEIRRLTALAIERARREEEQKRQREEMESAEKRRAWAEQVGITAEIGELRAKGAKIAGNAGAARRAARAEEVGRDVHGSGASDGAGLPDSCQCEICCS